MSIRIIVTSVLLGGIVSAAEPNTLTPKEIEEGWLLLFDGDSTFGWTTVGDVKASEGKLTLAGGGKGQAQIGDMPKGQYSANGATFIHSKFDFIHFATGTANADAWNDIKYKPADLKPIFNGKDLSGWKVFNGDAKRNASKWEVTNTGELHVNNGPGDLQSNEKYGDFILQYECKTNGPALNSGIFFRCRANEYQQGYEAQIQNGIVNDDRTKPVDFGTGAIYRRVKARQVVSNDKEWFTMTVLAVGPRLRTWVNGYPVVDWTDDRKPADNARNGLYTQAGHLSIQGHDPTTDIHFRNIRIADIVK